MSRLQSADTRSALAGRFGRSGLCGLVFCATLFAVGTPPAFAQDKIVNLKISLWLPHLLGMI